MTNWIWQVSEKEESRMTIRFLTFAIGWCPRTGLFFFNVYLFLRERQTDREHELGRGRERERETESAAHFSL